MTARSNITITKAFSVAAILVIAASAPVFAHSGFDHILGTVVKEAGNVLTVKTAKGNVDVKLDDTTELTRNGQKASRADLTPGARVVVDVPEGNPHGSPGGREARIAHSVKIGVITKTADQHTPGSHK